MARTGKIAEVLFEQALETYEHQMQMLDLVSMFKPNGANMQNSSAEGNGVDFPHNFSGGAVWRPVQQHAPIIEGWDISNAETDIVEETYPALLGTPKNDFFKQRADDLRDLTFWERRGRESGKKQATMLNKAIANAIAVQGSLFYEYDISANPSGYNAIAEAQAMLNERQKGKDDERFCVINDRDNITFSGDLAGRQTLQGRPEETWKTGMLARNVAEFDVYTGSFLSNIAANAVGAGTVASLTGAPVSSSGDSFIPAGGSVDQDTGAVTNVDYRVGTIVLGALEADSFNVGDKVAINGVNAVGMADKSDTGQLMTFTVVAAAGANLTVYPKPIFVNMDDGGSADEPLFQAYGNCFGSMIGATVDTLNETGGKSNIFGCKSAIEVTGGEAPIGLLSEFGGMKVISSTMSNGQVMYMAYDGDIGSLTFNCRLFTWYGLTVADPGACGSFTTK